jgi:NitT/TauT family transport system substrate-binding protein
MKKIISFILLALLLFPAFSCNKEASDAVRVITLNGTTGFGMAELMMREEAAARYDFTVESAPDVAMKALISGEVDICALPTNEAAKLYNRTEGDVVLLALNTKGVLYLVTAEGENAPTSLAALSGKTVYCPQSPAAIVKVLLEKAALTDVTLDTSYAQPAALQKALIAGEVTYAILPEPMVTAAVAQTKDTSSPLSVTLDLTAAWSEYFESPLVQGCIVARRDFVEAHPDAVKAFLADYETSVNYAIENPEAAAELIVAAGIFPGAPAVAAKALPRCNLCFITGDEMQSIMHAYLSSLPFAEIGDALPAEDFYLKAS